MRLANVLKYKQRDKSVTYSGGFFEVSLFVEVWEQMVKEHGVHADPPNERARVVTVDEQQLERVQEHQHELNLWTINLILGTCH